MVRWCMEDELEEEEEVVDDDDEYEEEEEEINSIQDNGPLLDARLLWDNLWFKNCGQLLLQAGYFWLQWKWNCK